MCNTCKNLDLIYTDTVRNAFERSREAYEELNKLSKEGKLTLFFSDYDFDNFDKEISNEYQFVYDAYFRCNDCKLIYRLGICVRGTPSLKILKAEDFNLSEMIEQSKKLKKRYFTEVLEK